MQDSSDETMNSKTYREVCHSALDTIERRSVLRRAKLRVERCEIEEQSRALEMEIVEGDG